MKHISEIIAPEVVRMTLLAIGWQMESEHHFWCRCGDYAKVIEVSHNELTYWPFWGNTHSVIRPLPITQDELLELIQIQK